MAQHVSESERGARKIRAPRFAMALPAWIWFVAVLHAPGPVDRLLLVRLQAGHLPSDRDRQAVVRPIPRSALGHVHPRLLADAADLDPRHAPLLPDRVPVRVLARDPRDGAMARPAARPGDRSVLRQLPDPHDRMADPPLPRRPALEPSAAMGLISEPASAVADSGRRAARRRLQLPGAHDLPAVRGARPVGSRDARGVEGLRCQPLEDVPPGDAPARGSRDRGGAAPGLHPAHRRLHHRPGARRSEGEHGRRHGRESVQHGSELGARSCAGGDPDRDDLGNGRRVRPSSRSSCARSRGRGGSSRCPRRWKQRHEPAERVVGAISRAWCSGCGGSRCTRSCSCRSW